MRCIKKLLIGVSDSICDAIKIIDENEEKIALVVGEENEFLGTVTDGDVRRAILKGISLNSNVGAIFYRDSVSCFLEDEKHEVIKNAKKRNVYQIPVLNRKKQVEGIHLLEEIALRKQKNNKVVLMVGGLGKRLRPLTDSIPKPMLKVGNKPILQTIVERFSSNGYKDIIMCVNYKADTIRDFFGDGSRFGVKISYIFEEKRMGTAGALALLKEKINEPFFVMNGDLLTNVNFENLYDYHLFHDGVIATVCAREYDFQVPYGVIKLDNSHNITKIEEKPIHKFFSNAGIYMLSHEVINYIPENKFYDMPNLLEHLIKEKKRVITFPLKEYWIDIGHINEYEKANNEYTEVFNK